MRVKLFALLFILLLVNVSVINGQKKVNSPYARFNIGTLTPTGSFRSLGMGGTGIAMRDNTSVSFYNPASYTSIDTASFIFDFGTDFSAVNLNDGTNKFRSGDFNFNHLIIGFPISGRFGFSTGIVPLSNGYYNISDVVAPGDPGYDANLGEVTYTHKGTGSLGSYYLGTGARITRNISLGVNMSFVFGGLDRINNFDFTDYANTYNQASTENLRLRGVRFDYGLQVNLPLKNKYFITAGVTYTPQSRFGSTREYLSTRYSYYNSADVDTLVYTYNHSKDSTKFPSVIRAGITIGKTDKFMFEVDYTYSAWGNAMIHGNNAYLANTSSFNAGIEYIPEKYSNTSFLKRAQYRLGGHMSDNYLVLNGVQVKEYGASLGVAFRLRLTNPSIASFYFDFTRRNGDTSKGLFNENIFSAGVSLNLYDWWFLKRKYD